MMDNKNNIDDDKFKNKIMKEILETEIQTDDKLQEQLHQYINKMIKTEISKQLLKDADNIKYNIEEVTEIYIHDIDFNNYEVNTALDEIIEEKDFKYGKIAEKMGINRATLSNMIDNPNSISLVNAFKVSKLLGISIEEVFFYTKKV